MTTIDPRLAERRKEVAEDRARRNIERLLRLFILLGLVAGVVWLLLSPTFSVRTLEVTGAHSSDTAAILEAHEVVPGRPLILIRPGAVEAELASDPWIREAHVDIDWPDTVIVSISERSPAAWVQTDAGWSRRAVDGVALPGPDEPDSTMGRILLPVVPDGAAGSDPSVLGALEFVETLPVALGSSAVVEERDGELWAVVGGFDVRLGRPTSMADKALSLAVLLAEDLEPGSTINMIAPTNPAVTAPLAGGGEEVGGAAGGGEGQP